MAIPSLLSEGCQRTGWLNGGSEPPCLAHGPSSTSPVFPSSERGAPPEALSGLPTSPAAAGGCEASHAAPGSGHPILLRPLPACCLADMQCACACVCAWGCVHTFLHVWVVHACACVCLLSKVFRNQEGGELFPNPRLDIPGNHSVAPGHTHRCVCAEETCQEGPRKSHRELSPLLPGLGDWPRTCSTRPLSEMVAVSSECPAVPAGGCSRAWPLQHCAWRVATVPTGPTV